MIKRILLTIAIVVISFLCGAWYVINNLIPTQIVFSEEDSALISFSVFGQTWHYYTEDCKMVNACY